MNILFLDQFSSLGGAQHCLVDPAMADRGWSARVGIPAGGPLHTKLYAAGIPVHCISTGYYNSTRKTLPDFGRFAMELPRLLKEIAALIEAQRIDLVYVNGPRILPASAIAARHGGVPLIFHCHVRLNQGAAIRATGWALRHARATVIGCCEFAVAPLRKYVDSDHLHVIYNGTSDFGSPLRKGARRVGIVGRIEPDKGQMEFVHAARILQSEFPEVRFAVIGAPLFSSPSYFYRVRNASAGLQIEFQGWQENMAQTFSSIDVLAVPSAWHDPNPRVILEAFSARVPVVAFPSGGIPEIVADGETGFLTAARSPQALAARLRDVLKMDPAARDAIVERARAAWECRFTAERFREDVAARIALRVG